MEEGSIEGDLQGLEQWYAEYMTQDDPVAAQDSTYTETIDLKEIEARSLELTRDIEVIDGFCSVCYTMLDDWPDLTAEGEIQIAKAAANNRTTISPQSSSMNLVPGIWANSPNGPGFILPCQGQTVRLDSARRRGCLFCGLMLQRLEDSNCLDLYRRIERRLHVLGKPSTISLLLTRIHAQGNPLSSSNQLELTIGFPGRLFWNSGLFSPIRLYAFGFEDLRTSTKNLNTLISSDHLISKRRSAGQCCHILSILGAA